MEYEGSVVAARVTGLLGKCAKGVEVKGRIEIRANDTVFQNLHGSAEIRFKVDKATKFDWLVGKGHWWTKWFPVQAFGKLFTVVLDERGYGGTVDILMSNDGQSMAINGFVDIKQTLRGLLLGKIEIAGMARRTNGV